MQKYLLVFKQALNEILEYRFDFFLNLAKYTVMILMMSLIWKAVQQLTASPIYSTNDLIVYFFLAATLYSLSNFHPYYIEEDIRLGGLNKYLIKPISPTLYYFIYEAASVFIETVIKIAILIPLIFLLGFHLNFSAIQVAFFLLYLPLIFIFSFNFLTLISLTSFWITEASALRWAALIVVRLLSGMLVPISFFTPFWQKIFWYLPFQYLGFAPIQLMINPPVVKEMFMGVLILGSWTTIVIGLKHLCWRKGLALYEGVGI